MSMIGKLRQVSEFELAKYKASPSEMVRALAGARHAGDPQAYTQLRENLQQSPVVQQMMELSRQGKPPTREQQLELQEQMRNCCNKRGKCRRQRCQRPSLQPSLPLNTVYRKSTCTSPGTACIFC